mgnify:CR=1 FL=1
MTKRTDKTSTPKQSTAQDLLESATALLTNRKDVATVKEDAVNRPFSPLSFFNPTPLSVASVIAFLFDPKASHGQSTLFLNAFCEDLTRHLEAAGLALSVKVPPLTGKTSIYLTETTKPQDVEPRAFNNGLVIVRCTPTDTAKASNADDSSPSLDIKLQRGKAVLIADFDDSDCPWRTNGEGADIVRYSIVDCADMLMQTVEKIDVPDVRWFVKAFARYLLTNGADTRAGRKRKLYELLRSPENVTAAACISEAYADLVERNWQRFVRAVTDACRERYKFEVECDTHFVSPENPEKFALRFLFTTSEKWCLSFACRPNNRGKAEGFCWGVCLTNGGFFADEPELAESLSDMMKTLFGYGDHRCSGHWAWLREGRKDETIDRETDVPYSLEDPYWFSMLNRGDFEPLTRCLFSKLDAILKYCEIKD